MITAIKLGEWQVANEGRQHKYWGIGHLQINCQIAIDYFLEERQIEDKVLVFILELSAVI